MALTTTTENTRLGLQQDLDGAKSSAERNELGQFATPTRLALEILRYAQVLWPDREQVRFLDPAIGTGSFYSALQETFPTNLVAEAVGYEIDPHYAAPATELWADTSLDLRLADFTTALPPLDDRQRTNLLICNPPYVRHHHIPVADKLRLLEASFRATGVRLSGLAGLYCHFLLLSHSWLARGGIAGWLIPSEFMDVNYGREVKRYLLDQVTLLRIHRFDPNEAQFDDALVSSAVVWFRNETPPAGHAVEFTFGGTLMQPKLSAQIPTEVLRRVGKWTRFPAAPIPLENTDKMPRLADLFDIKRGLATGANDFFVLTQQQVAEYQLPTEFLRPILPSPRYLSADEINADTAGNPILEHPLYLLSCSVAEEEVEVRYPTLWAYLQIGIKQGVKERYLSRHRSPWYVQEKRGPAPLLCTYLGRSDTKRGRPFRFIINHSQATAANVYLMLYPKPAVARVLRERPELLRNIWQLLNEIAPETLLAEGRVYGGGLHKLEPKELANTPADNLVELLGLDEPSPWIQPQLTYA